MDTLIQDIHYALRAARQKPGFTLAVIITLALGIGATTAIFSVVHGVLLSPLPYEAADRLVVFGQTQRDAEPSNRTPPVSLPNFTDWQARSRTMESMALWSRANVTVTNLGDAESIAGAMVTADFFEVLEAEPFMGRSFTAAELTEGGPNAVIVSWEMWQARFGGAADILERTLEVSGEPRPIVGVTPRGFAYPRGAALYVPHRPAEGCDGSRSCVYMVGIGRLADGRTVEDARSELVGIASQLEQEYPVDNTDVVARVNSLEQAMVGDVRQALWVLLAAVFMVLLIACANVANLLLVRGAGRAPELAVRSVLGASRTRVIRQLMTENVLLALLGGVTGVVLASWGVELLRAAAPQELPRIDEVALSGVAVLFALGLVLFTATIFGLVPAVRLARATLAETLRGTGRGDLGVRQGWGRAAILVAEVALSVVLLLGAGLMMRSMAGMNRIDTGWQPDDVAHFTIGLPQNGYGSNERNILFFEQLQERLKAQPGVREAGVILPMPLSGAVYGTTFIRVDQRPEPGREPGAVFRTLDSNAFAALGIQMASGRAFEPGDRMGSELVAIINEAAAEQYWPGENPIGRQIEVGLDFGTGYGEQPRTIVGVSRDIRGIDITTQPEPEVWVPWGQSGHNTATVVVNGPDAGALVSTARAEVRALDPNLPLIRAGTAQELVLSQTATSRFYLLLLGIFAALALTLAAVGIYGVVAFVVARRSREIGVRMALGARIRQVVGLVVWQGVRPALVGLALGVAGAIAAGRIIGGLLFDVAPHDPLTFAGVTLVLLAVVVLACIVPAGRASRIPPASALRGD